MIVLLRSRHYLKQFTYITLLMSGLMCAYYVYYVHKIRPNIAKTVIHAETEKSILLNKTYLKYCPVLEPSSVDIDTSEVFQDFDLEPIWLRSGSFWDDGFETRYKNIQNNSSAPTLKVILVPHSHNDPGWLETYVYYYNTQTSKILNNIIEKLEQYQDMTFIWSEVTFLKTWWNTASILKRKALKELVKSGRLEITTGGWVMADEATTHLYALVDQLLEGHQWLSSHLGIRPKYGWSVDVFGHSSTQPQLLALSGINATVTQRIHYAWKRWFADKQKSDFIWVPNWTPTTRRNAILAHNQPFNTYTTRSCGPNEFICSQFDFRLQNEDYPINIDESSVKSSSEQLLEQYARTGSLYDHNVILVPLGCDFCFKEPRDWDLFYENYQRIIKFVNKNSKNYSAEIQFGTVGTYFEEVIKRKTTFPTLKGDFFVYADLFQTGLPGYWSGYFTTRPSFKLLGRSLEAKLRSCEILYAMALYSYQKYDYVQVDTFKKDFSKILQVRQTLALFQHHDSITGTSKSFVMKDNAMRLLQAIYEATGVLERSVRSLLFPNEMLVDISEEILWNDLEKMTKYSIFRLGSESIKKIIFFNPLAQRRVQFIKVLTSNINAKVRNHITKKNIITQISPVWEYYKQGTSVFISPDKFELSFIVDLPPMSLTAYELYYDSFSIDMPFIYSNKNLSQAQQHFDLMFLRQSDIQLENSKYIVRFNGTAGLMKSIYSKKYRRTMKCVLDIAAYTSVQYLSGAYIFQPEINAPQIEKFVLTGYDPIIHVVVGQIYSQLTVIYGNFFINSIRLYKSKSYLSEAFHIENAVDFGGPENHLDTELFMRFKTDIDNSDPPVMYTDCNGFHMQKRTYVENSGIPGNYYPITTMVYIEDKIRRLSLLTNHAQGTASLRKGSLEVMLDRRIIFDDDRGLGEGIVDNTKFRNEFWLILEYFDTVHQAFPFDWNKEISKPSMFANHMSNSLNYPVNLFSIIESDVQQIISTVKLFQKCFPCDVHVVTLRVQPRVRFSRTFSKNAFLILHRQGYSCKFTNSYTCTYIDFKDECGFDSINMTQMVPMTLTGLKRLSIPFFNFSEIDLLPMAIQTYNVTFS